MEQGLRNRVKDFIALAGVSLGLLVAINQPIDSMISDMRQEQTVKEDVFDSFCRLVDPTVDGVIVKSEIVCSPNLGMGEKDEHQG